MSVCLVAMPWQALDSPSLPIGLLRAVASRAGLPTPLTYHANLRWVEFLMARTDNEIGPAEYHDVAENGLFHGLGDWVFTGVLHDDPTFGVDALTRYADAEGVDIDLATRMREHAADFVALAAAEILHHTPSLVGFTSTFMQNVPSLAVAKRIKRLAPAVRIVFGGGNCDGPMGAALHRNYPFVDFVVRGEGEDAFPALLRALDGTRSLADIPGLCWRDEEGVQRCNVQAGPVPVDRLAVPDFVDWFGRLEQSPVNNHVEPRLVLETSRGCWWGEKHHCTFCGLNGTLMKFRAKPADAVLAELHALVGRHQTLDLIMVDNIIDSRYFTELLPRIADLDWDLRIYYEMKANLKPADIRALRAAGVLYVQPGIESLVTSVLTAMDKGVSALQNVRTLRDCESAGLTVSWNWLYGFPGETPASYASALRQLPALVHLQPPIGVSRICLERFSPYFDNPAFGFAERTTARSYRHVYGLEEVELRDMVYLFDTVPAGLSTQEAEPLTTFVEEWSTRYVDSSLRVVDDGDTITILDRRVGWRPADHRIVAPHLQAAYRELRHGRSVDGLCCKVEEQGFKASRDEFGAWLKDLRTQGLVFEDNGRWVTVATDAEPMKLG